MTVQQASSTVDYVEWTGENGSEVEEFLGDAFETLIPTLEQVAFRIHGVGEVVASKGDLIIRGRDGAFHFLKPDVFAGVYEPERPWTWRFIKWEGAAETTLQISDALTAGVDDSEELQVLISVIAEVMARSAVKLLYGEGQEIAE